MFIVRYQKFFLIFTLILVIASLAAVFYFGFPLGIDFTGGTIIEVEYQEESPELADLEESFASSNLGQVLIKPAGEKGFLIRSRSLTEQERQSVSALLSANGTRPLLEKRFESIGPVIGAELKNKAIWAIALVIFLIVVYITFAFRRVSRPVSSWKYGLITVLTLLHDVAVPTGFFVVYSYFVGTEIDLLFITALLAILGFSVHDTIVVFDRIRENLSRRPAGEEFKVTVGRAVGQTIARSINTSLTTLLPLLALYFLGPVSIKSFSLLLSVGIVAGTYSSICLASPLLVVAEKIRGR